METRTRIRADTFSMAKYSIDDDTGTVGCGNAFLDRPHHYPEAQNIGPSTRAGHASAIKFWTAAPGGKTMQAPALRRPQGLSVAA